MNRDGFHEEINKGVKSRNVCCFSIQKLLPSPLSQRNISTKIERTVVCYVVLRGCKTVPYTPSEESRPKIFDNQVKRKVFGPKSDNVTRDLEKLHEEKLHDLYSLPSVILVMK